MKIHTKIQFQERHDPPQPRYGAVPLHPATAGAEDQLDTELHHRAAAQIWNHAHWRAAGCRHAQRNSDAS